MQNLCCAQCGAEITQGQPTCPACGAALPTPSAEDAAIGNRLAWVAGIMGEPEIAGATTPILDERVPPNARTCPACGSYRVVVDESSSFLGKLFGGGSYLCLACGHKQKAK